MLLKMKVKPNARGNKLVKVDHPNYGFKVSLKALPENGKANKELVKFLAKQFGVTSSEVSILKGHTANVKLVQIGEGK